MKRLALLFLVSFLFFGCGTSKKVVVVTPSTPSTSPAPSVPSIPSAPSTSPAPSAPSIPSAPSTSPAPSVPSVPSAPSTSPAPSKCKYTYTVKGKYYCVRRSHQGFVQVGIASWYGPGFHGSRTASGEIYNMYKLTAAHKTLPLGTFVKVINLENGRSVIVKINDRGPFVKGRIIDLSYAAAKKLGMLKKGTARVKIIALGRKVDHSYRPLPYGRGRFFVQVGAFKNKFNAYKFKWRLVKRGLKVRVVSLRGYYRVLVGPVSTYEGARRLKKELLKKGLHGSFIIAL